MFIDLPDDVLHIILKHFILNSIVEELIRLETICKRLRYVLVYHAKEVWMSALETLDERPPFTASRTSLSKFDTPTLRQEVLRAVQLDRSWKTNGGPSIKGKITIPFIMNEEGRRPAYGDFRIIPKADLILASIWKNGLEAWSISQRTSVWRYVDLRGGDDDQEDHSPEYSAIVYDYEVMDSAIMIALLNTDESGISFIRVIRLDLQSYTHATIYISPPLQVHNVHPGGVFIRNNYAVIRTTATISFGLIFIDWRQGTYYRFLEQQSDPHMSYYSMPSEITTEFAFFMLPVQYFSVFRLSSFRYKEIVGSSSEKFEDWPVYSIKDFEGQPIYSSALLPHSASSDGRPCKRRTACHLGVVTSTWSVNSRALITATLNATTPLTRFPTEDIHEVELVSKDGGEELSITRSHAFTDRMMFLTDPTIAGRAMVRMFKPRNVGTATISTSSLNTFTVIRDRLRDQPTMGFHDVGEKQRIELFQPGPFNDTDMMFQTMDPLGRTVLYASRTNLLVIMLDEK